MTGLRLRESVVRLVVLARSHRGFDLPQGGILKLRYAVHALSGGGGHGRAEMLLGSFSVSASVAVPRFRPAGITKRAFMARSDRG